MNIGIYQEPSTGIGGAEFVACAMAESLCAAGHCVEIVHHHQHTSFSSKLLADFFLLDLTGVKFRRVSTPVGNTVWPGWPGMCQSRQYAKWEVQLSQQYDVFIANVHNIPPRSHASRSVLHVLFPFDDINSQLSDLGSLRRKKTLRYIVDLLKKNIGSNRWSDGIKSYDLHLAISNYVSEWTLLRWGIRCAVLYPPAMCVASSRKESRIVSLARFCPAKQQDKVLENFINIIAPSAPEWELVLIGGVSDSHEEKAFLENLQIRSSGQRVRIVANAIREDLAQELAQAKIFWHAMGVNVDIAQSPSLVEHYGIAIVEAMSAGCVPVVSNQGGPSEIVENGKSGYSCSSYSEMADRILSLIDNNDLFAKLSLAASLRSTQLSLNQFRTNLISYLSPLMR